MSQAMGIHAIPRALPPPTTRLDPCFFCCDAQSNASGWRCGDASAASANDVSLLAAEARLLPPLPAAANEERTAARLRCNIDVVEWGTIDEEEFKTRFADKPVIFTGEGMLRTLAPGADLLE